MNYLDDGVQARISLGGGCFLCDDKIESGEPTVFIRVDIPAILTTIKVEKEMHLNCAAELAVLVQLRIKQAKKL
jgi:hypothetical protein